MHLTDAIRQVTRSYEWAVDRRRASPFFFVIGAGVSAPQVPLAREIIQHCKELCGVSGGQPGGSVLDEYSYWLNEAYNAPELRQDYFRRLIEDKPIPAAQFRLAHLLLGEGMKLPFTNLVVTTNFDNFLTRALGLFGKDCVLCDSPLTAPRLVLSNPDLLQIIHVHGNYQFYDIKNLTEEISETAELSDETTATMSSLLESLLRDRSPIVVGYGGWDGDVFMRALRRRLRGGTLPHPLYWCCYERGGWRSLPAWLQVDSNVRFVEPDAGPMSGVASEATPAAAVSIVPAFLNEPGLIDRSVLHGQAVFDALIQALSIPEPSLTRNPVAFFADQLDRSLPKEGATHDRDPYRIQSTIDEMRASANWIVQYRHQRSAIQQQLHGVREHLRAAKYLEAIALALEIAVEGLTDAERNDLLEMTLGIVESPTFSKSYSEQTLLMLWRVQEIGSRVAPVPQLATRVALTRHLIVRNLAVLDRWDEAAAELGKFVNYARTSANSDIVLSAAKLLNDMGTAWMTSAPDQADKVLQISLDAFGHLPDEKLQPSLALALGVRTLISFAQNKSEAALALADQFLSRFSSLPDAIIQKLTALLLSSKAIALRGTGQNAAALTIYDEILTRLGESADPFDRQRVAKAMLDKGLALDDLDRRQEAVDAYDQLLQRFDDVPDPKIREHVIDALVAKGIAFTKLDRPDDALVVFDYAVGSCGSEQEATLRNGVARALMYKAFTLWQLKRENDALGIYDVVVSRFGDTAELDLRFQAVTALAMRGVLLQNLGRNADAIAAYEAVDHRYGESVEPVIREQVALALSSRASLLGEVSGTAAEIVAYEQFVQRFGDAEEAGVRGYVGDALNGWAFALLRQTKAEWDGTDGNAAATLNEAEHKIDRALAVKPLEPVMLANKGYILFLLGRIDEAAIALGEAIELGGVTVREGALADADVSPTPLDEAFKALVRNIVVT